jgi:hypothetical protein
MKTKLLLSIVTIVLFIAVPTLLHAQDGVPDPGGDPDVPIDGGLSLLLAAGVGYVAKKGYDARKKKAAVNEA